MKVVQVTEVDGHIQAVVEFEDGFVQTVQLPSWATKDNIKDEAQRLRKQVEDREKNRVHRPDLVD